MHHTQTPMIALALALAGCSTTSIADLESQPPRETFQLTRSTDDFVRCMKETMGRLGAPTDYERPDGTRVLAFTIENETSAMFLIRGSEVEARTISRFIPFRNGANQCL